MAKLLVLPYSTKKKSDKEASALGAEIINLDVDMALVKYKGKRWCLATLIQHLAKEVKRLNKNQCEPSAKCLFEGQEYMNTKYEKVKDGPSKLYD